MTGQDDTSSLFDGSYWRTVAAKRDGREFLDAFYERLLATSEEVRAKFAKTDFEKQKQVLMLSLAFMSSYAASNRPNVVLEKIAHSHRKTGLDVRSEHYDAWLTCLLETVREYDPEWSPAVEAAWRETISPGIAFMKAHYED